MFIEGCGADATQFTSGQHWLEQIARVHGTTGGTSTDNGMDFIDKQHDLTVRRRHFLQHSFQALFEFPAVLGPCNQGAHIEGNQLSILQRLGNVTVNDALRQPFNNGCFTDAGLAD